MIYQIGWDTNLEWLFPEHPELPKLVTDSVESAMNERYGREFYAEMGTLVLPRDDIRNAPTVQSDI